MRFSYRSIGQSWVGSAIALFILSIFIGVVVILMEDSIAVRELEAETARTHAQAAATQAEAEVKQAQAAAAQADAELARANGERAILEAAAQSVYADQQLINAIVMGALAILTLVLLLGGSVVLWVLKQRSLTPLSPVQKPSQPEPWRMVALHLASVLRSRGTRLPLTVAERRALELVEAQERAIFSLTDQR